AGAVGTGISGLLPRAGVPSGAAPVPRGPPGSGPPGDAAGGGVAPGSEGRPLLPPGTATIFESGITVGGVPVFSPAGDPAGARGGGAGASTLPVPEGSWSFFKSVDG